MKMQEQDRRAIFGLFVYISGMKRVLKTTEDTKEFAKELLSSLNTKEGATILAMNGDLGSGKTTLTQFIGRLLGIEDNITSPTFLIERVYELKNQKWQHLVHIDAYRLEREQELLDLGWEDVIKNPNNLVVLEWAERVASIIPEDAIHIGIKHGKVGEREIEVE